MSSTNRIIMIQSTTEFIFNKEIDKIVCIARGSTVKAKNIGRDILADLQSIIRKKIDEYIQLQADTKEQAIQRMIQDTEKLRANAIINIRFTTAIIMNGFAEILAYETATKYK